MGLHLCYELALPSETPREGVLDLLDGLRSRAERIGFDRISEIRELEGEACEPGKAENLWTDAWHYFRIMAQGHAIDPDRAEVRDETGYHEHRDPVRLLEEVRRMNRIVARIAGHIHDALEPGGHRTESAIFAHPEFEHLEGDGRH